MKKGLKHEHTFVGKDGAYPGVKHLKGVCFLASLSSLLYCLWGQEPNL
jgi:hypothetical protein